MRHHAASWRLVVSPAARVPSTGFVDHSHEFAAARSHPSSWYQGSNSKKHGFCCIRPQHREIRKVACPVGCSAFGELTPYLLCVSFSPSTNPNLHRRTPYEHGLANRVSQKHDILDVITVPTDVSLSSTTHVEPNHSRTRPAENDGHP